MVAPRTKWKTLKAETDQINLRFKPKKDDLQVEIQFLEDWASGTMLQIY